MIVLSLPPAAVGAPVYSSGGASSVGPGVGSGAASQPTGAASGGSDSYTDIIQRLASASSPGATGAHSVAARPLSAGKALTAATALPVGTLLAPNPKMMPAASTRAARVKTAPGSEDGSGESSDSAGGEADSQSTASTPATPSLPVSAVPALPVPASTVGAAAVPLVPLAVTAAPGLVQDDVPLAATPVKDASDKDSPVKPAGVAMSNASQAQTGAPQAVALPIPIDVTVPQINVRPRLSDASEASSSAPVESTAQPATSSASQPEAAVNIVIQAGQANPVAPQAVQSNVPEQVSAPVTAPIVPAAVVIPAASVEPDRKKIDLAPSIASGSEPQQIAVDAPVKVEQARAESSALRHRGCRAPVHEPIAPEKAQTAQVKSLSLEFTPDGARDVRVRIAERAGEVHVSLHSSDPGVARDLRSGAADLGGALTQAGYDAQTWTSGRQQQNPQQPREEQQQRRDSANTGTENFDGLMTETTETL